jgi:hypothetical protein
MEEPGKGEHILNHLKSEDQKLPVTSTHISLYGNTSMQREWKMYSQTGWTLAKIQKVLVLKKWMGG